MSAPGPLAGRVARVTGASRGISRAAEQVTGQRVEVDAGGLH